METKNKSGNSRFDFENKLTLIPKSKRSQITVFIIIAIVLVAVGGTAYYMIKSQDKTSQEFFSKSDIKPTTDSIKSSVINCQDISAKDSLDKIGIQGGYSSKPEKNLDLGWAFIPYYYDRGNILMPTKEKIQVELGKEYEKQFLNCLNEIKATGFEIKHGTPGTRVSIKKGEVLFNMDMAVSISKEDNTMKIQMKDAPLTQVSKLYEIIEIAKYITDSHKNDSEMICVTCIADMAEQRDVYVNAFDLNDNSVLYVVSENKTSSEPYSFEWLNKYPVKADIVVNTPGIPSVSKVT